MFLDFFLLLKEEGLPVSIGEYLNLLDAMNERVTAFSVEEFYFLSKTILIKHAFQHSGIRSLEFT